MSCARCFAARAAMVLLVAASGCGLDGPAPSDKAGAGAGAGPTVPASASASFDNLKKIGRAFQNYASTYSNAFPPAATVDNGTPPCSWRVKLLPFLEEDSLYRQYRMDEPWDSPHNLEIAKQMPKVYQTPVGLTTARLAIWCSAARTRALTATKTSHWRLSATAPKTRSCVSRRGPTKPFLGLSPKTCLLIQLIRSPPWARYLETDFLPSWPTAKYFVSKLITPRSRLSSRLMASNLLI